MDHLYDVIIVGGGPAGLSAAIYLARAKYHVLVLEKENFGGQIRITSEIVNYPGVKKTSGTELTDSMRHQAENFGAEFMLEEVVEMDLAGSTKRLATSNGKEYHALGVLLASGASPRKVGFTGEKEFQGRGVAYCATCDGEFFTGREVLVIGGGFAAAEEAMFLTKYAKKVTILVREDTFSCAASVVEALEHYPAIEVLFHTELLEAGGDGVVSSALLRDNRTGELREYRAMDGGNFGIFVFAGYKPETDLIKEKIILNEQGYIVTDQDQKTSQKGVYAAGDVCIKNLRQVVTAVSDGAVAATSLEKYVSDCRKERNLPQTAHHPQTKTRNAEITDAGAGKGEGGNQFLSSDMIEQLSSVFAKFEKKITVAAVLNGERNSGELESFADELKGIHEKVAVAVERKTTEERKDSYLDIRTEEGSSGIRYYSVPGGHEFNSFVVALYNAAGPGKQIGEMTEKRIQNQKGKHLLQVMTTLSCTNCPEVVMGTQKIASLSPNIEAEMYDISQFPDLKAKYIIMAVPCLVIDGEKVYFGKRGVEEILENLEAMQ